MYVYSSQLPKFRLHQEHLAVLFHQLNPVDWGREEGEKVGKGGEGRREGREEGRKVGKGGEGRREGREEGGKGGGREGRRERKGGGREGRGRELVGKRENRGRKEGDGERKRV